MPGVLLVALGGALGSAARYGVSLLPFRGAFPLLTLAVNLAGAVLIGLIAASCLSVAEISLTSLLSLAFFGVALLLVWKCKVSPILTLVACGALGGVVYGAVLPALGL